MAEIELPSTPKDINHAMATEVMGGQENRSRSLISNKSTGFICWTNPKSPTLKLFAGVYTPSTDLNQAFEGLIHVRKSLTDRRLDIATNDKGTRVILWDWRENAEPLSVSDNCTTPEALATALCLALIAAKRGEG